MPHPKRRNRLRSMLFEALEERRLLAGTPLVAADVGTETTQDESTSAEPPVGESTESTSSTSNADSSAANSESSTESSSTESSSTGDQSASATSGTTSEESSSTDAGVEESTTTDPVEPQSTTTVTDETDSIEADTASKLTSSSSNDASSNDDSSNNVVADDASTTDELNSASNNSSSDESPSDQSSSSDSSKSNSDSSDRESSDPESSDSDATDSVNDSTTLEPSESSPDAGSSRESDARSEAQTDEGEVEEPSSSESESADTRDDDSRDAESDDAERVGTDDEVLEPNATATENADENETNENETNENDSNSDSTDTGDTEPSTSGRVSEPDHNKSSREAVDDAANSLEDATTTNSSELQTRNDEDPRELTADESGSRLESDELTSASEPVSNADEETATTGNAQASDALSRPTASQPTTVEVNEESDVDDELDATKPINSATDSNASEFAATSDDNLRAADNSNAISNDAPLLIATAERAETLETEDSPDASNEVAAEEADSPTSKSPSEENEEEGDSSSPVSRSAASEPSIALNTPLIDVQADRDGLEISTDLASIELGPRGLQLDLNLPVLNLFGGIASDASADRTQTEPSVAQTPTTQTPTTQTPTTQAPASQIPTTETPATEALTAETATSGAIATASTTTATPTTAMPTNGNPVAELPDVDPVRLEVPDLQADSTTDPSLPNFVAAPIDSELPAFDSAETLGSDRSQDLIAASTATPLPQSSSQTLQAQLDSNANRLNTARETQSDSQTRLASYEPQTPITDLANVALTIGDQSIETAEKDQSKAYAATERVAAAEEAGNEKREAAQLKQAEKRTDQATTSTDEAEFVTKATSLVVDLATGTPLEAESTVLDSSQPTSTAPDLTSTETPSSPNTASPNTASSRVEPGDSNATGAAEDDSATITEITSQTDSPETIPSTGPTTTQPTAVPTQDFEQGIDTLSESNEADNDAAAITAAPETALAEEATSNSAISYASSLTQQSVESLSSSKGQAAGNVVEATTSLARTDDAKIEGEPSELSSLSAVTNPQIEELQSSSIDEPPLTVQPAFRQADIESQSATQAAQEAEPTNSSTIADSVSPNTGSDATVTQVATSDLSIGEAGPAAPTDSDASPSNTQSGIRLSDIADGDESTLESVFTANTSPNPTNTVTSQSNLPATNDSSVENSLVDDSAPTESSPTRLVSVESNRLTAVLATDASDFSPEESSLAAFDSATSLPQPTSAAPLPESVPSSLSNSTESNELLSREPGTSTNATNSVEIPNRLPPEPNAAPNSTTLDSVTANIATGDIRSNETTSIDAASNTTASEGTADGATAGQRTSTISLAESNDLSTDESASAELGNNTLSEAFPTPSEAVQAEDSTAQPESTTAPSVDLPLASTSSWNAESNSETRSENTESASLANTDSVVLTATKTSPDLAVSLGEDQSQSQSIVQSDSQSPAREPAPTLIAGNASLPPTESRSLEPALETQALVPTPKANEASAPAIESSTGTTTDSLSSADTLDTRLKTISNASDLPSESSAPLPEFTASQTSAISLPDEVPSQNFAPNTSTSSTATSSQSTESANRNTVQAAVEDLKQSAESLSRSGPVQALLNVVDAIANFAQDVANPSPVQPISTADLPGTASSSAVSPAISEQLTAPTTPSLQATSRNAETIARDESADLANTIATDSDPVPPTTASAVAAESTSRNASASQSSVASVTQSSATQTSATQSFAQQSSESQTPAAAESTVLATRAKTNDPQVSASSFAETPRENVLENNSGEPEQGSLAVATNLLPTASDASLRSAAPTIPESDPISTDTISIDSTSAVVGNTSLASSQSTPTTVDTDSISIAVENAEIETEPNPVTATVNAKLTTSARSAILAADSTNLSTPNPSVLAAPATVTETEKENTEIETGNETAISPVDEVPKLTTVANSSPSIGVDRDDLGTAIEVNVEPTTVNPESPPLTEIPNLAPRASIEAAPSERTTTTPPANANVLAEAEALRSVVPVENETITFPALGLNATSNDYQADNQDSQAQSAATCPSAQPSFDELNTVVAESAKQEEELGERDEETTIAPETDTTELEIAAQVSHAYQTGIAKPDHGPAADQGMALNESEPITSDPTDVDASNTSLPVSTEPRIKKTSPEKDWGSIFHIRSLMEQRDVATFADDYQDLPALQELLTPSESNFSNTEDIERCDPSIAETSESKDVVSHENDASTTENEDPMISAAAAWLLHRKHSNRKKLTSSIREKLSNPSTPQEKGTGE